MIITPQDLELVGALCQDGRHEEALALCAEFIEAHRDHPLGYHLRASVRARMGIPERALADRDKVVALLPQDASAYVARADDLMRVGAWEAAIADLARAEKLDDGRYGPALPLFRADCLTRLGRWDEALAACALVPDDFATPAVQGEAVGSKRQVMMAIEEGRLREGPGKDADADP